MSDPQLSYGLDDDTLANRPLPWRPGLFDGRTVLVTGASGGLGRAAAWAFGRLGARVAAAGRDADKLRATVEPMRAAGLAVEPWVFSIRDPQAVDACVKDVVERFVGLDALVHCAGGQFPQPAIDFSVKGWNAVVDTNLNGTWYLMQAAARHWRDAGRPGAIVNVITVTGRGQPGIAHSCAARAGVEGLTRTVAVEWAPHRIRVNCIAPGAIDTEGQRVYTDEARRRSARGNPMMRFGDPWDIADAAVFLAGDTAKFMTGQTIAIDGGGNLWGEFWVSERPAWFDETTALQDR